MHDRLSVADLRSDLGAARALSPGAPKPRVWKKKVAEKTPRFCTTSRGARARVFPRIWQVCHKHHYYVPVAADGPLPAERRAMIRVTPTVAGVTPVA